MTTRWGLVLGALGVAAVGTVGCKDRGTEGQAAGKAAATTSETTGCTRDTDCKGDRICEGGRCVSPAPSSAASGASVKTTPSAAPTAEHRAQLAPGVSGYGRLEVRHVPAASRCDVVLRRADGSVTPLLSAPDCTGTGGMAPLSPTAKVGFRLFPAVDASGREFHLFEIATARGGNAVPGFDYYAIAVRDGEPWATKEPFARGTATRAEVKSDGLVVEEAATTTAAGWRATITFGSARRDDLPMLRSSIVSTKRERIRGGLSGPFHASNHRPMIAERIIDDDGSCPIQTLMDQGTLDVTMVAEVSTWSDGRKTLKCISVQR